MKKILYLLVALNLLSSCGYTPSNNTTSPKTRLETFVENFRDRYPDGYINDVVADRSNEEFKKEIVDSLSNNPLFLTDIPLKLEGCKEYSKGKYAAHFQSWITPYWFEWQSDKLHEVGFDIIAIVSEDLVLALKEKEYYYVFGKFQKFISYKETSKYVDEALYTPRIGLFNEVIPKGYYNIDLGFMLFDVTSVKQR